MNLGPTELIIILVIVLIIFGVGRLPEIGGALGKSIREFRSASKEDKLKADKAVEEDPDAGKPVA
jgi:sec-independent protein translocase protein TatA